MSKMVQVRHVPDSLHRKLKQRAATEGVSLSDFLKRELRLIAERPTNAELRKKLSRGKRTILSESPAEILRERRGR